MRKLSVGALAVLAALIPAVPAHSAPSHAETGAVIALNLERGPGGKIGEIEAAAVKGLNAGWGSVYVSWAALQPTNGAFDAGQVSVYRDRFVSLREQGLKVNVTFIDTPTWASGTTDTSAKKNYYPPQNPAMFGNFITTFATEFGAEVDGYELGNEPDGGVFWLPKPDPAAYAGYAKAGIAALQATDPSAVKFIGATAGANDEFMEEVLKQGVTGYDAVAFHSGTACKTDAPGDFIREETGSADIFNTNTTAYREMVHMMRSLGIANPVVADTAAGWASMPEPNSCNTGASTGKKPGGVTEAVQSLYLRDQFACAEQDPELKYIFIFSLYDVNSSDAVWDHRMGLIRSDRSPKDAYRDLGAMFASGAKPAYSKGGFCGGYVDHKAPAAQVTTTSPVVGGVPVFSGPLQMTAKGTDEHPIKAVRIAVDGKNIPGTTKDGVLDFPSWQGAKDLKLGEHTISATVEDEAGNVTQAAPLKVKKVTPSQMPLAKTTLTAKVKRVRGRKVTITGRLTWPKGLVKPSGRVRIWFKKGKFVSKYGTTASKPFTKTFKLRKPGKWKVYVSYAKTPPFSGSKVKTFTVKVK